MELRPTGPPTAAISPPSVNLLLLISFSPPLLFITSMKMSVPDPPAWKPKLPPSIRMAPGADQPIPFSPRHKMNPLPHFPPNMNAALLTLGAMMTHSALSSSFCGIALSSAPMISPNAVAAESSLWFTVSALSAQAPRTSPNSTFFRILTIFLFALIRVHSRLDSGTLH